MPNPIFLSLVFHNHQPVGNFDFVNEHAYGQAYLPMVQLLENHPGIAIALHFSGSLLDWLSEHHPELLERIKALVARGQVEILTGGYYEPILVSLQDVDKIGQIRKLTEKISAALWHDAARAVAGRAGMGPLLAQAAGRNRRGIRGRRRRALRTGRLRP